MAVMIGGLIVIGLVLAGAKAALRALEVELTAHASLALPLLLAALLTLLFLLFVPGSALLPEGQGWAYAGGLIALAWLVNGALVAWQWKQGQERVTVNR